MSRRSGFGLDVEERLVVLKAICRHAEIRNWLLYAAHVRSNHVHVVVEADVAPEKAMEQGRPMVVYCDPDPWEGVEPAD